MAHARICDRCHDQIHKKVTESDPYNGEAQSHVPLKWLVAAARWEWGLIDWCHSCRLEFKDWMKPAQADPAAAILKTLDEH